MNRSRAKTNTLTRLTEDSGLFAHEELPDDPFRKTFSSNVHANNLALPIAFNRRSGGYTPKLPSVPLSNLIKSQKLNLSGAQFKSTLD